jgi:hypothetical protein
MYKGVQSDFLPRELGGEGGEIAAAKQNKSEQQKCGMLIHRLSVS